MARVRGPDRGCVRYVLIVCRRDDGAILSDFAVLLFRPIVTSRTRGRGVRCAVLQRVDAALDQA